MKKCSLGKGIKLMASFLKLLFKFNWLGSRKQAVTPLIAVDIKKFKSPYLGVGNFRVRKQMSYRASLSIIITKSAFSVRWWKLNTVL
mmetsp:Transcript_19513/g.9070  ORF Transcript_19513/g.9070 Transcript_19513/m.9070 type:complete len:87 (+) Transcript_19513:275-535(+)